MIIAMILVSTVIVAIFSYVFYRNETIKLSGERALGVAITVAAAIEPEGFDKAMAEQKKDAQWDHIKAFADQTAVDNDLQYLYILDDKYDTMFTYYAEGWNPATGDDELDFLYRESTEIHDETLFIMLETGVAAPSAAYYDDVFGWLVTGYAPILDSDGNVTGIVGADVAMEDVMLHINSFALKLIGIVLLFSILFAILSVTYINRKIGRPIVALTTAAEKLSVGDLNLFKGYNSNDEIGRLSAAFTKMIESTKAQIDILNRLAGGDLSMKIVSRSTEDSMSFAIDKTIAKLTEMFSSFQQSSDRLADTSIQIANEAKVLADSATNQLSTIETLAGSVAMITEKTKTNAETAENTSLIFDEIHNNASLGTDQMARMVAAVNQINDACLAINRVVATIDDIAFQTNILALNAAVEAARAGQKGKGFAVVADEVRNLAAKSASSSQETADLIANALEKAALGVQIATDTSEQLGKIIENIRESGVFVKNISVSSAEQRNEIAAINASLDHVTGIVHQTAQSARESADAGDMLSTQADQLNKLLRNFKYN
jgi:methyl-accepting chemotaxis protein